MEGADKRFPLAFLVVHDRRIYRVELLVDNSGRGQLFERLGEQWQAVTNGGQAMAALLYGDRIPLHDPELAKRRLRFLTCEVDLEVWGPALEALDGVSRAAVRPVQSEGETAIVAPVSRDIAILQGRMLSDLDRLLGASRALVQAWERIGRKGSVVPHAVFEGMNAFCDILRPAVEYEEK